jgi:hypothetical protein
MDTNLARIGVRMVKKLCNFYATQIMLNSFPVLGCKEYSTFVSKEENLPRM